MMINLQEISELNGTEHGFPIIAGPCSAESREQVLECARSLSGMGIRIFRAGVWKPRTRPGHFEGWGEKALGWLKEVKSETGMTVMTEVANSRHVEAALKAGVDMFWIGARTTTSPFAVQEIADALRGTDIPVFVKNPINTELQLWLGAFERLYGAGITRLAAIHRGFSVHDEHIYRYSPQWQIPVELRRCIPGLPVICDPSHMGGRSSLIPSLSQMALDMKADGLFVEVHPNPREALSDSAQQLTPEQFKDMLVHLKPRNESQREDIEIMQPYRLVIEGIDRKIAALLAERLKASRETGNIKLLRNLTILQPDRYKALADDMVAEGKKYGLEEKFIRSIFETIHAESIKDQLNEFNNQ